MGVCRVDAVVIHRALMRGVGVPCHTEGAVRDDRRIGLLRQSAGVAEVVGMAMGDEHLRDVLRLETSGPEPGLERLPALRTGQPGVDDGDALFADDCIGVDMGEPGKCDRQLHAQHSRRDFGDFLARRLLLLPRHGGGRGREVSHGPTLRGRIRKPPSAPNVRCVTWHERVGSTYGARSGSRPFRGRAQERSEDANEAQRDAQLRR